MTSRIHRTRHSGHYGKLDQRREVAASSTQNVIADRNQMGYPVITVTEQDDGLHIRQDRFLESGPASSEDNKTIW